MLWRRSTLPALWLFVASTSAAGCYCSHVASPPPDGAPSGDGGSLADGGAALPPLPPGVIPVEALEGEWWHAAAVTHVSGAQPDVGRGGATAPFVGALSLGRATDREPTLARVRFQLTGDEVLLLTVDDARAAPLAAFPILERLDVDPETGAHSRDRPPHERRYLRVGWDRALLEAGLFGATLDGATSALRYRRRLAATGAPVALHVERVAEDPSAAARWPARDAGTVHYFSAGVSETWTPEDCALARCEELALSRRLAFLRVPPTPRYEVRRHHADEEARFALLRVAGEEAGAPVAYRALRQLWETSLRDAACTSDAACDPFDGSTCDPVARRCTLPLRARVPARASFELPPDYPRHLVRGVFEAVAQWNEALMTAQRAIDGRAPPMRDVVTCQPDDPTAWCYCGGDVRAPEVMPDTRECSARSDWFTPPAARAPGAFDCWIEGRPDPARPSAPDAYGDEVLAMRFVGEECRLTVTFAERALEDLRAHRIQHVPDAAWCAIAQPRLDPTTGEIVTSRLHVGGGCLAQLGDIADALWPVLRGERSEGALFGDPAWDGYYERIARIALPRGAGGGGARPGPSPIAWRAPATPRRPELPARDPGDPRFSLLGGGPPGAAERELVEPFVAEAAAHLLRDDPLAAARLGVTADDPSPRDLTAAIVALSPLRGGAVRPLIAQEHRDRLLVDHLIFHPRPAHYAAGPQRYWARAFAGRPAGEARLRWQQALHRALIARLVGHGLGLAPNLAASLDRDHYPDAWFARALADPMPRVEEHTDPGTSELDGERFWAAHQAHRERRMASGLGNASSASVLDVHGDLSDLAGVGRYDRAAAFFDYFDLVEVIVTGGRGVHPFHLSDDGHERLLRSDLHPRRLVRWYGGGEPCETDADCPSREGSPTLASGQRVHQRCLAGSPVPVPCGGARGCACSSLASDLIDYVEGAGPPSYVAGDPEWPSYHPVEYAACGPADSHDAHCNLDDAGESLTAIVAHQRALEREAYPWGHTRAWPMPTTSARDRVLAARIAQHMLHRYYHEPVFRPSRGPLGFTDHYVAMQAAHTWLAELAARPDIGRYRFDAVRGLFEHAGDDPGALELGRGLGFSVATRFDAGGRVAELGAEWERVAAAAFTAHRDFGMTWPSGPGDAAFADFFPLAWRELVTGLATDHARSAGPRVGSDATGAPALATPWRFVARCRDARTGEFHACRAPLADMLGADTPVVATGTRSTRRFAGVLATPPAASGLYARVWPLDEAAPWPDAGACAAGAALPGSGHPICADPRTAAYRVQSSATGERWVAAASPAFPWRDGVDEYPDVGFGLLATIRARHAEAAALEASAPLRDDERRRLASLRAAIAEDEAVARAIVEVARAAGITTWIPPAP